MNIALLSYRGNRYSGGQGVYVHYLTRELLRRGHGVHVLSGPPYPELPAGAVLHRLESGRFYDRQRDVFLPRPPEQVLRPLWLYEWAATRAGILGEATPFSLRAYQRVCQLQEREGFDLIHDNQGLGPGLALLRAMGFPTVATIHHPLTLDLRSTFVETASWRARLRSVLFHLEPVVWHGPVARQLDAVIAVSRAAAAAVQSCHGVAPERLRVVYNGLDADRYGVDAGEPVERQAGSLLFVGRVLDRKKGARDLLAALARLRDRPLRLTIVDRQPAPGEAIVRLIERLGLVGRVRFTGRVDLPTLRRLYRQAELLVMPSHYEGFGLPALEALASGTPVVVAAGGALAELVEDGVTGRVVPAADPLALAAAIAALHAAPAERARLAANGQERVRRQFTWAETARQTEHVYQEICEARHAHL